MQAMREHDERTRLQGMVQLDDAYWGGERRDGKRGRGASPKPQPDASVVTPMHRREGVL